MKKKMKLGAVLGYLALVGVVVGLIFGIRAGIRNAESYCRTWENPITVEAFVSYHDMTTDSEDDEWYYSYIRYTVDGVEYSGIQYESKGSKSGLTPVGERVTVQVSAEDPSKLLSELKENAGYLLILCAAGLSGVLAFGWNCLLARFRTKALPHQPDRETAERDGRLTIWGEGRRVFWLLTGVSYLLMLQRYKPVFDGGLLYLLVILCAVFFFRNVRRLIRILRCLKAQTYVLRRDVLERKEIGEDSEGNSTYELHYRNEGGSWMKTVSKEIFDQTVEGHSLYALYTDDRQTKPFLYYDQNGNCCD